MSYLARILALLQKGKSHIQCPLCKRFSTQPASKKKQGQTMMCPYCKSFFVKDK